MRGLRQTRVWKSIFLKGVLGTIKEKSLATASGFSNQIEELAAYTGETIEEKRRPSITGGASL